jgi:hypothetical protein
MISWIAVVDWTVNCHLRIGLSASFIREEKRRGFAQLHLAYHRPMLCAAAPLTATSLGPDSRARASSLEGRNFVLPS